MAGDFVHSYIQVQSSTIIEHFSGVESVRRNSGVGMAKRRTT